LIASGTIDFEATIEVISGGFGGSALASTTVEHSIGQNNRTFTDTLDVSGVSGGDYTVILNWDDSEGNSGTTSGNVSISGDGGGSDPPSDPPADPPDDPIGDPPEADPEQIPISCSINGSQFEPGETFVVTADIGASPVSTAVSAAIGVTANGTTVASETVTVTPNSGTVVNFDLSFEQEGGYNIATYVASAVAQ